MTKNFFWEPLRSRHPDLVDIINEDIRFVLSLNSKGGPRDRQGAPYFEQRKGTKRTSYWTSECASFTVSVLINYLNLCSAYGLQETVKNKDIIATICRNLDWITYCRRGNKGWAWTNDSPVHPWPTWSLLDTFEELLSCSFLESKHAIIGADCKAIHDNIIASFTQDVPGTYLNAWNEKVVEYEAYEVEAALDLVRLMLAVTLHGGALDIIPLAKKLFKWASQTDFSSVEYSFHFGQKADYIYDSSLIPCVFRTLLVMIQYLPNNKLPKLDEDLGQSYEVVLNRVYTKLMESHITQGKYKGLFGVRNGFVTYELYYTERTIEALTEFLLQYQPSESVLDELTVTGSKQPEPFAMSLSETTSKKLEAIGQTNLPILEEIAHQFGKTKEKRTVFENTIIIFVLHLLRDLVPFVEKFHNLGCLYEDMFFLTKTYAYPEREIVEKQLRDSGSKIRIPEGTKQSDFFETAKTLLSEAIDQSKETDKRILIVEDGGYFVPFFHNEFSIESSRCYGAVEQTTKGFRRDLAIKEHSFPIISIANSQLKLCLEAPEVADTLQENLVYVCKKIDKNIHKCKILILGYGNIGEKLAEALGHKGMRVYIYDSDPMKRMKAETARRGYSDRILENKSNLGDYEIIVGTSGETSLIREDLWSLRHGAILASGSSERIEFDLEALDDLALDIRRDGFFTLYTIKKDDKIIKLLCDGEPINFPLSGGISKPIIDVIYAEMLWAAAMIRNESLTSGIMPIRAETEAEIYRVYKKYYGF